METFETDRFASYSDGTGPLPHPANQRKYILWVTGWGSGPVPNAEPKNAPSRF